MLMKRRAELKSGWDYWVRHSLTCFSRICVFSASHSIYFLPPLSVTKTLPQRARGTGWFCTNSRFRAGMVWLLHVLALNRVLVQNQHGHPVQEEKKGKKEVVTCMSGRSGSRRWLRKSRKRKVTVAVAIAITSLGHTVLLLGRHLLN